MQLLFAERVGVILRVAFVLATLLGMPVLNAQEPVLESYSAGNVLEPSEVQLAGREGRGSVPNLVEIEDGVASR
jgi:hypothetical protein